MAQEKKLLVTIDDKVYDLTAFKEVHPGGKNILEQYHEKDATDVFWSFHGPVGHERLKQLKGVPIENPPPVDPHIQAFRQLRIQLREQGFFQPDWIWELYKIITTISFLVIGTLLTYYGYWLYGAILYGIGYQQLGWLGHDACHQGLTTNRKLNNALGYLFGNVLNGFSVNWWKDRHNTHHAITNVLDADPDVDNLPLFVWSEYDLIRITPDSLAASFVPHQHLYFIPWTTTLKLIWSLQSFFFLREPSYHNRSYTKSLAAEKYTLLLHYVLLYFVLRMTPSFTAAVLFFLISEGIGGAGIALIVFMNHYACEQLTKCDGKDADFLKLQLHGTKNIEPSIWMDWLAGGLNYQVEHHLFPTIPRNKLSKLKPIVEKFCKEHQLPYLSYSYTICLTSIVQRLAKIAAIYRKQTEKQNSVQ